MTMINSSNIWKISGVVALLVALAGLIAANNSHIETHEGVIVSRVDMQQEVSTDDQGKVSTRYICKVYTDHGLFEVEQSGWLAHPELIAQIKDGDTLNVTTRGFSMPIIGIYPTVVGVEKR